VTLQLPELRTTDIEGPVAYRLWDGPPESTFLMVHGLGGSHLSWIQAAPGLAGLGRVLALDLPGFGWSPRAGRPTGLMDARRTISRFIAELGTGDVVLCGNSMGGALAVLQAAVEPGSVEGLVLTGSVYPWVGRHAPAPAIVAAFTAYRLPWVGEALVASRSRALDPDRAVHLAFHYVAADPASIPAEIMALHADLLRRRLKDPDAMPAFLDAARSMLRLGRRPGVARRALDHVEAPVLILHGQRDRLVPVALAEAELRRHPSWRGRFFPDLGHVPQMEAPGRWVSEVADWHAGLSAGFSAGFSAGKPG
jgi:pimeloyl-ACP methyl ester carboxylesterase